MAAPSTSSDTASGSPPYHEKQLDSLSVVDTADHTLKPRPWIRKTTPWSHIIGHNYKGSGTEQDPYVVTWLPDGPDGFVDVENPLKYGFWYKWGVTIMGT